MILAALDIGTLTCRLLIADLSADGRLTELHAERRILRLGEGVDRARTLHPSAMARVLETLIAWRQIIRTYAVDGEAAVATSAVRDAENRDEFLARIQRETGFSVEVLSGEEEARRTMLGIRSGLPPGTSNVLALDIGGGSMECIVDRPGRALQVRSFELGVVRLTERVLTHDPPTAGEIEVARTLVRTRLASMIPLLPPLTDMTFVGTAGTITTLTAMAQGLDTVHPPALSLPRQAPYPIHHARIHNHRLKRTDIVRLESNIVSKTQAERRGMPGLEPGREDVIGAGAIMFSTAMSTFGMSECLVSHFGLREGVLINAAACLREGSFYWGKP
jgi:exopolyphosphatase/guanosine-5'-triphosphate,3'-diphosphate pyrophosphatase